MISAAAMASRFFHPPESDSGRRSDVLEFGAAEHQLQTRGFFLVFQRQVREGGCEYRTDGVAGGEERILRNVSQASLLSERTSSGVGRVVSGQDFEQGGFAAAVGADQTSAVAFREAERKIFK